jgi:antitoxin PrlF
MNEHTRIKARSTLTSKGQTTVPKEVREALQMSEGVQIDWVVEKDGATATVKPRTLRAVDLAGILGKPPKGRGLRIEDIDDAIAEAVVARFERSQR